MSFPPRPPMIPHGMPPNIMQQPPFSYSGLPMPPMPIMNMNRPPPTFSQIPIINKPPPIQHPVTKVFVGNISERAPDSMIRQMLQRCGNVLSWKRVEGTNGKLQAFGFCDFAEPQYTLRCIRLLNGYEIADKKLMVKVDQKTRELLGEFIRKNRSEKAQTKNARKAAALRNIRGNIIRTGDDGEGAEDEEDPKNINLEAVDEDTLKEDRSTIGALELILKQFASDLEAPVEKVGEEEPAAKETSVEVEGVGGEGNGKEPEAQDNGRPVIYMKPHLRLEEIKLDDDKKELMTNEISKFRETHKEEELRIKQEEAERLKRLQEKERESRETRDNNRSRNSRDRSPYGRDRQQRSDTRDRETRPLLSSRGSRSDFQRSRSRSLQNERREPSPRRRERRQHSPESNDYSYRDHEMSSRSPVDRQQRSKDTLTAEELEEERERKKLERKLREKEMAYRARLKVWEEREEKKRKVYLGEKKNEMQKRKAAAKEAKKLKQFMEDYDDDNDDSNYFKGSNLEKKLKFREKEIESDNRDRQREKEELEELKKRLCEKGFSDVEHEAKRIQEDENLRMKHKFEKIEQSSSSSDEESADEQQHLELQQEQQKSVEAVQEETSCNANEAPDDDEVLNNRDELKKESNESVESMCLEENENAKTKTTASYSEESNSPFFSQDAKPKLEVQSDATYDTYASPNSNSPTFQGMNVDSNDSRSASNTHHVLIKSVTIKKSIQPINQAFADEDDEPQGPHFKRAKLISTNDSASLGMNSEERKKAVKKLVESIPTDRDELFAYKVDWEQLDEGLMEKRIKPWINKKIIEYIGEEEATLHDFICQKIQQRTEPGKLLEEIKVILDDEAELFVKKMWRLIVYETESKRCGLSR